MLFQADVLIGQIESVYAIEIHKRVIWTENARLPIYVRFYASFRDRGFKEDDGGAMLAEVDTLKHLCFPSLDIDFEKIDGTSRAMKIQQVRQR